MKSQPKRLRALAISGLVVTLMITAVSCRSRSLGPKPYCHKILTSVMLQWGMEHPAQGDLNGVYPNDDGESEKTIAQFAPYLHNEQAKRLQDYAYVPGLRDSDPENLILMYMKQKTRYTWHGDTRANRNKLMWIVFAPSLDSPFNTDEWCPEGARKLNTREFRTRLQATLDYLKTNNRPYWTNTVREHSAFLNSIKE